MVGAGPGGMTAAYYLALKGHRVRVLESAPQAGGMILLGIPRYRLPLEVIAREVGMIADLGVEFRFSTSLRTGRDLRPDSEREGFEAVFLAIGAHAHLRLNIPGEAEFPQVTEAIGLLRRVALGQTGRSRRGGWWSSAAATWRSTPRGPACGWAAGRSSIAYRRTRAEMPADHEEIEQALEEGVRIEFLTIPVSVAGAGGLVQGLRCLKAELVQKDGSTRLFPVPIDGSEFLMPADTVIAAIGQQVERSSLESLPGLKWTRRGTVEVDPVTMQTAVPGVFRRRRRGERPGHGRAGDRGRKAGGPIDRPLSERVCATRRAIPVAP